MYPSQTLKQDPVMPQRETSPCSNWVFSRLNPPDKNAVREGKEFSAVASPTAPALDWDADLCFGLHKQYFSCKTLFLFKSTQTNAWNIQLRVVSVLSVSTKLPSAADEWTWKAITHYLVLIYFSCPGEMELWKQARLWFGSLLVQTNFCQRKITFPGDFAHPSDTNTVHLRRNVKILKSNDSV